jgi:hypothetical protein
VVRKSVEADGYSEDTATRDEDERDYEHDPDEFSTNWTPENSSHVYDCVAFWMVVSEIARKDGGIYSASCQPQLKLQNVTQTRYKGNEHRFSAWKPTMQIPPPTAPRLYRALGIPNTPVAIWVLMKIKMARCQVTVRYSTPLTFALKTSRSSSEMLPCFRLDTSRRMGSCFEEKSIFSEGAAMVDYEPQITST